MYRQSSLRLPDFTVPFPTSTLWLYRAGENPCSGFLMESVPGNIRSDEADGLHAAAMRQLLASIAGNIFHIKVLFFPKDNDCPTNSFLL